MHHGYFSSSSLPNESTNCPSGHIALTFLSRFEHDSLSPRRYKHSLGARLPFYDIHRDASLLACYAFASGLSGKPSLDGRMTKHPTAGNRSLTFFPTHLQK